MAKVSISQGPQFKGHCNEHVPAASDSSSFRNAHGQWHDGDRSSCRDNTGAFYALKSLDVKSNAKACHNRKEVTSISLSNISKPKPVSLKDRRSGRECRLMEGHILGPACTLWTSSGVSILFSEMEVSYEGARPIVASKLPLCTSCLHLNCINQLRCFPHTVTLTHSDAPELSDHSARYLFIA